MNNEALIAVSQLTRYFGDQCAVSGISFTVQRGEVLGFLGPNGAGKTTTMQMICGVLAASSGEVSIAGYDILDAPKQAKAHIGFLPEQPPLYTDLTVDEYLLYCGRLRRIPKSKLAGTLANSKQRCGLEAVGKRLIGNLSRGYQQRVGIAQAIIHSPAVVILDEPTAGLDPIQIREIRQLIGELGEDHSVILSTHILPEVQGTCDRVLIIDEGRLVLDEHVSALQRDKHHNSLSVALENPPVPEVLEAIDGVDRVDCVDKHRFRISYSVLKNTPVVLSEKAAASGWGLYEMIPESDILEEIFVHLIRGEGQVESDAS
ncbi:MAG: ABC transporter ATP-binding protein [Gammaproteobacteria bacterium]